MLNPRSSIKGLSISGNSLFQSKAKVLDNIRVIKQNRNPNNSKLRKVVTIDTETEDGNIFLLEDDSGRFLDHTNITFENFFRTT